MSVFEKVKHIGAELKGHAPFTVVGALLGLGFMLVFRGVSKETAGAMFGFFHPAHVVLSALVTASLFRLHAMGKNFLFVLVVGVVGSIGVATLSDSVIPFVGESVLGVSVPSHSAVHGHGEDEATVHAEDDEAGHVEEADGHVEDEAEAGGHVHGDDCDHADEARGHVHDDECDHGHAIHIGFIEEWHIVFPAAILGVIIAYLIPRTRCPHAAHVLISTWASSSHVLMSMNKPFDFTIAVGMFIVLFLAVWLPCCISDIVFPLLFVGSDVELKGVCACKNHSLHSHPHTHEHTDECEGGEES